MISENQLLTSDQSLEGKLRQRIGTLGPITFRDWMETALYDSVDGYYCRAGHSPWGRKGDYRTSVERTVLFSETFARYFAKCYAELREPNSLTLMECGAGSGAFARGVLQVFRSDYPHLAEKVHYVVDERGKALEPNVQEELARFEIRSESLAEMCPIEVGIIFGNELLDAFPVHRVMQQGVALWEFYVAVDPKGNFGWKLGELSTPKLSRYFSESNIELTDGQIAEVNLDAEAWLQAVAEKLQSGYLILVDYGAEATDLYNSPDRFQGTLRSFRSHRLMEELLARPGDQDLTTTIDWTFVKRIAERLGFQVVDFQRQDKFLLEAGILDILEARINRINDEAEKMRLRTEAREMVLPSGMAGSFQVLVLKK